MPLIARAPNVSVNANPQQYMRNLLVQNENRKRNTLERTKLADNRIFREQQIGLQRDQLDFNLAAPQRKLDEASAERERKRQVEIDKANVVTSALEENEFAANPNIVNKIFNHPGMKKILEGRDTFKNTRPDGQGAQLFTDEHRAALAEQGQHVTNYIAQMRANPSLHADPNKIERDIRRLATGYQPEVVDRMVEDGLRSFKVMDAATAKLKNTNINEDANRTGKLVEAAFTAAAKGNGNTVGTGSGFGRGAFNKGDSNGRANQEFLDGVLERSSAKDVANWLEKVGDWVNPFNMTDLTREDLAPILNKFEEAGIRPLTAIQLLEGEQLLVGGEWTNTRGFGDQDPAKIILGDLDLMTKLVAQGQRMQQANSSNAGGFNSLASTNAALSLGTDLQTDVDARRNQLFAGLTRSKATVEQRTQRAMDFITEQTGVKPDFKLPDAGSRTKTNNALLDTDTDGGTGGNSAIADADNDAPATTRKRNEILPGIVAPPGSRDLPLGNFEADPTGEDKHFSRPDGTALFPQAEQSGLEDFVEGAKKYGQKGLFNILNDNLVKPVIDEFKSTQQSYSGINGIHAFREQAEREAAAAAPRPAAPERIFTGNQSVTGPPSPETALADKAEAVAAAQTKADKTRARKEGDKIFKAAKVQEATDRAQFKKDNRLRVRIRKMGIPERNIWLSRARKALESGEITSTDLAGIRGNHDDKLIELMLRK